MGLLVASAVQEGDDLRAVADGGDAEGVGIDAGGDALLHGPCHGGGVEFTGLHIGKADRRMGFRASLAAPQEGDDLGPVAGGGGTKVCAVNTGGDAILHGPQDGLVVEVAHAHIAEGVAVGGGLGGTGGTPQEGHDLGPVAGSQGTEVGFIHAGGDALLHGPQDALEEEAVVGHIHKGILAGCITAAAAGALPVMAQSGRLVGNIAVAARADVRAQDFGSRGA